MSTVHNSNSDCRSTYTRCISVLFLLHNNFEWRYYRFECGFFVLWIPCYYKMTRLPLALSAIRKSIDIEEENAFLNKPTECYFVMNWWRKFVPNRGFFIIWTIESSDSSNSKRIYLCIIKYYSVYKLCQLF